jgi:dTDP-4-dehydrorhamnose reductase
MRIAVTGKVGQVVSALLERGPLSGIEIIPVGRPEVDLAGEGALDDVFAQIAPDAIVSAAAYTAVDKAEAEPDLAQSINAGGAGRVAQAAARLGVPIVHLSTDYVFDGSKLSPYVETDATAPLGVYGRTKLAGEQAVALAQPNHAILRTAWVYSPFGNNFLKTMLRLAVDRPELRVVADQVGNPTSALDIADAVLTVVRNLLASPDQIDLRGVFLMVGKGEANWADFARGIVDEAATHGRNRPSVVSITTADYPTPAKRPANSRLATDKLFAIHGVVMPEWQVSMRQTVARLA